MTLGKKPRSIWDEGARLRRGEQAEDARRNGGPRPYRADEAGNTACPNCDLMAWSDSMVCPYCGARMPKPGESRTDPLDTVKCPACGEGNRRISVFCDQCGSNLPPSAHAAADEAAQAAGGVGVPNVWGPGHPTSSAGRRPGVSPAARSAYLAERNASLGQQARPVDLMAGYSPERHGQPLLYQLSRCEAWVEQAEKDVERAQQDLRDRRYEFGGDVDLASGRYLDAERRELLADYHAAEAGQAAAMAALTSAKRLQSALLADYEETYRATALGRIPDVI